MALRSGSLSRSLLSTVRSSTVRRSSTSSTLPRVLRPLAASRPHRRPLFSTPRTFAGEFGCVQSLMPLQSPLAAPHLTSHIYIKACAFCELSQGT